MVVGNKNIIATSHQAVAHNINDNAPVAYFKLIIIIRAPMKTRFSRQTVTKLLACHS